MIPRAPWGGLATDHGPAEVVILGVPWDGAACWRGGAAQAPQGLRAISHTSPAISELGEIVDPRSFRVRDRGDVAPHGEATAGDGSRAYFARVEAAAAAAMREDPPAFLLGLGGDHSVTIPLVRAFAAAGGPFGLVLLDAHPDLFDVYDGSPLSAACPMRRALDTGKLRPEHLLILGTRSYNAVELEFMREHGIAFLPAREVDRRGAEQVTAWARERLAGVERVYLTLDIDVADPACAPGTGAPVAGGLSSRQLLDLTRGLLEALPVRAMDVVEISPELDPTQATLFLGLQLAFETFAVVAGKVQSSSPSTNQASRSRSRNTR
jgi:agmatinase